MFADPPPWVDYRQPALISQSRYSYQTAGHYGLPPQYENETPRYDARSGQSTTRVRRASEQKQHSYYYSAYGDYTTPPSYPGARSTSKRGEYIDSHSGSYVRPPQLDLAPITRSSSSSNSSESSSSRSIDPLRTALMERSGRMFYDKGARQEQILEPRLPSNVAGQDVLALLDHGSSGNFLSMDFARRQGLQILPTSSHNVKAANGAKIALAGTVDAPFGVTGTSKIELLRFHIMATGVTDVILGHRFLQLTKAFTRFRAQIVHTARRARGSCLRHVRFLQGSVQQVRGYLDHGRIDAVADTGSDVTLLSSLYARERGLKVSYNRQDQVELEFADGSTMWTQGCVRDVDWKYDSVTPSTHRLDAYILNSLPCGVLIGYDVLYATDAFAMHADALFSQYDQDSDIEDTLDHNLNYIHRRSHAGMVSPICSYRHRTSTDFLPGGPETALEAWQAAKTLALSRYGVAQSEAQALSAAERDAFLAPFRAEFDAVLQAEPPTGTTSGTTTNDGHDPGQTPRKRQWPWWQKRGANTSRSIAIKLSTLSVTNSAATDHRGSLSSQSGASS